MLWAKVEVEITIAQTREVYYGDGLAKVKREFIVPADMCVDAIDYNGIIRLEFDEALKEAAAELIKQEAEDDAPF